MYHKTTDTNIHHYSLKSSCYRMIISKFFVAMTVLFKEWLCFDQPLLFTCQLTFINLYDNPNEYL